MWDSTYEVPLVVDADIHGMQQTSEVVKHHLNEGAALG